MRRKLFYFSLFLFAACFLISCKKDHPDDIPKWLKQEIHDYKINNDGCGNYGCLGITEWRFKDSCLLYLFDYGVGVIFTMYDYDGNGMCLAENYNNHIWYLKNGECYLYSEILHSGTNPPPMKRLRVIWTASSANQ